MENTYTTKQGDAWDKIAFEVYGDDAFKVYAATQ